MASRGDLTRNCISDAYPELFNGSLLPVEFDDGYVVFPPKTGWREFKRTKRPFADKAKCITERGQQSHLCWFGRAFRQTSALLGR
eukprot:7422686-Pyramimonas_sp.AAC.1